MERTEIEGAISAYKNLLQQTDYMAIKHADGALTPEEYGPMRAKREEWREAINQCEAQLTSRSRQSKARSERKHPKGCFFCAATPQIPFSHPLKEVISQWMNCWRRSASL